MESLSLTFIVHRKLPICLSDPYVLLGRATISWLLLCPAIMCYYVLLLLLLGPATISWLLQCAANMCYYVLLLLLLLGPATISWLRFSRPGKPSSIKGINGLCQYSQSSQKDWVQ